MLISRKWLSQYIDLHDITMEELAQKVTSAGLEVEGIERLAQGTNLVIGEVLTCHAHPESDHLQVCEVDIKDEVLQIVCGAPNCRAGLKVIVAKVGAKLPAIEIKKGMIRGIESNGMLCSLLELGVEAKQLSDEQKAGIEELASDAEVGNTKVLEYLGLDDEILDIGLTPNRNDCLSAFAMAKEVGAILDRKVTLPLYQDAAKVGSKSNLVVRSETSKCSLYSGKIIRSIQVKESPLWMKQLLQASGVKSINNVVDISNLVMLETGQPLHFFDVDKLTKEEIIVKDGMNLEYVALDGNTYHVKEDDIMITVDNKPVAIGGVMGGEDTKVDASTTAILIEVASFDHVAIRNTARRLNLNTDSSIRYQKGIEVNAPFMAMDRTVSLLMQYADAQGIEETKYSNNIEVKAKTFRVSLDNMNALLGTNIEMDEARKVLNRLDFKPVVDGRKIEVTIPSYRQDIEIEADIAEELIRIIGFDDLKSTMPVMNDTAGSLNTRQQLRRTLKHMLSNQGFYEAITYTLVSESMYEDAILGLEDKVELASPMSEDRKIVRSSILPSLLTSVSFNKARSIKNIPLFEISTVYGKNVVEEHLAIALHGNLQENRLFDVLVEPTFYTLKGIITAMLERLGYGETRIMMKENKLDTVHFHPYQSAEVYIGRDLLGIFGKIHPNMASKYEVSEAIIAELNLEVILKNKTSKIKYVPISKYPQITRDLAFVVEAHIPVASLIKELRACGKSMIQSIEVFDIYTGEHVEAGYKSIALSIVFQLSDRTLTDEEIQSVNDKMIESLKNKFNAILRGV